MKTLFGALRIAASVATCAVWFTVSVSAATITWTTGTAMNGDGSSVLAPTGGGTQLAAVNFTNSGQPATVNGVTFQALNFGGSSTSGTNWAITTLGGSGQDNNLLSNSTFYPTTPSSSNLGPLLNSGMFMFTDSGRTYNHRFTFSNLTPGTTYQAQFIFYAGNGRSGQMTPTNPASNSSPTVSYSNTTGASFIVGEWVADATTQDFYQLSQAGIMSGFSVVAVVPEPSSMALAGLGVISAGIAVVRRRSRPSAA